MSTENNNVHTFMEITGRSEDEANIMLTLAHNNVEVWESF